MSGGGQRTVVVTRPDLPGRGLALLEQLPGISVRVRDSHDATTPEELAALVIDADAVLCTGMDPMSAEVLEGAGRLRIVASASVGLDHIDQAAAERLGIDVTNTPGTMHEACADLTWGLILSARRRIVEADRAVRAGRWDRHAMHDWLGLDLTGHRLGLVGFGDIARAVARRAAGFGMVIAHHTRRPGDRDGSTWLPLEELLTTSDVVSLHVPSTPQTRHLVGARELALMKATATLVNTSRGSVVDEAALDGALRRSALHSVGLDVFAEEPLTDPGHPLLQHVNVVVTPHIASATEATRAAMVERAAQNIVTALSHPDA